MRICVVIMLIQPPEIPVHCLSSCEDMCCNNFVFQISKTDKVLSSYEDMCCNVPLLICAISLRVYTRVRICVVMLPLCSRQSVYPYLGICVVMWDKWSNCHVLSGLSSCENMCCNVFSCCKTLSKNIRCNQILSY